MEITQIAVIRTDFPEKFGIPRQSGLADNLRARIVFEPEFRNPEALRGLDGFSHLWLIWEFSANSATKVWYPTVRPPRLGGNRQMGVFATRSPYRPNPLGLSCVEIESIIADSPEGPVINVKGADLMDGTPIYDIKPYIGYSDSRPDAVCGYASRSPERVLSVAISEDTAAKMKEASKIPALVEILELDPRPSYHNDPERVYGLSFAGQNIRFVVRDKVLTVIDIE